MKLLNTCLFAKGFFSNNSRLLRINSLNLCQTENRSVYSNSYQFLGTAKLLNVLNNETQASTSVRAYSDKGIFKMLNIFALMRRKDERVALALHLYRSIENVDFQEFYTFLELPDTFNSWFIITELHIWMLMCLLMDEERQGLKLRNEIVSIMWYDVEARLDKLGEKSKKIIKKQLTELSGRLPIAMCVYDEGLLTNDVVLAGAIWYKFFDKHPTDPRKIEILVKYIRCQVQHLSSLNLKNYSEIQKVSKIWMPVTPHIKDVMSGADKE